MLSEILPSIFRHETGRTALWSVSESSATKVIGLGATLGEEQLASSSTIMSCIYYRRTQPMFSFRVSLPGLRQCVNSSAYVNRRPYVHAEDIAAPGWRQLISVCIDFGPQMVVLRSMCIRGHDRTQRFTSPNDVPLSSRLRSARQERQPWWYPSRAPHLDYMV